MIKDIIPAEGWWAKIEMENNKGGKEEIFCKIICWALGGNNQVFGMIQDGGSPYLRYCEEDSDFCGYVTQEERDRELMIERAETISFVKGV